MRGMLVLAILAAAAPAVHAGDAAPPPTVPAGNGAAPPPVQPGADARPVAFHKGQIGVSARFGLGLRGIATYDSSVYCGKTDSSAKYGYAPVCTGRTPLAIDLEVSYGITRKIELLAELRLGLERDFGATPADSGPRPLHLSPGARFFFNESGRSKLFVTAQAVFDFTGYRNVSGTDYGVRSLEGLWIDLHRAYGIYFFAGETVTFSRWLEADLEGGIGIQGRYP